MQVSPPEWPVAPQAATAPRTRGFLLSAFLVLGMIGNMIAGAMDLLAGAAASRAAKDQLESMNADGANAIAHTSKMLHFMALAAFGHVVFMTGMWMWKKWGVYGYGCLLLSRRS